MKKLKGCLGVFLIFFLGFVVGAILASGSIYTKVWELIESGPDKVAEFTIERMNDELKLDASRCALILPSASSCPCGSLTAWMLNAAQSVHVVLLARLCDQLFRIDHDAHLLLAHGAIKFDRPLLAWLERVDDLRLVHDLAVDAQ